MDENEDNKKLVNVDEQLIFLRSLVDGLPFGLFCKDYQGGSGKFVIWNRYSMEVWGLEESSILGKTDYDLFPKDQADFFRAKDLETMSSESVIFIKEEEATSVAGKKTFVRTWKIPLKENGVPRYLVGISQNIAEIKVLENEILLRGRQIAANHHILEKNAIAKQVAHDVNNPLAILLGRMNQIKRQLGSDSPVEKLGSLIESAISDIKASAERVNYLTKILGSESQTTQAEQTGTSLELNPEFKHDLINLVAIAQGKSRQALRQAKLGDSANNKDVTEKIESSLESLDRILKLIENGKKNAS